MIGFGPLLTLIKLLAADGTLRDGMRLLRRLLEHMPEIIKLWRDWQARNADLPSADLAEKLEELRDSMTKAVETKDTASLEAMLRGVAPPAAAPAKGPTA